MGFKSIKKVLPAFLVNALIEYRRNRNMAREKASDESSEEFMKRKSFYAGFLNKGDLYFDIGANYGNRIGPVLALAPRLVVALEPQLKCCAHLKRKYKEIEVLQMGVGAENTERDFFVSNDSVLSSFSSDFIDKTKNTRFAHNSWEKAEKVQLITLDTLISKYGIPDFIKIDVEGFEQEVIKGLSQPVKRLSFEYTLPELAHNVQPIMEKLQQLGNCRFNYSIGESMELALNHWEDYPAFLNRVQSDSFIATGFGDIYVSYVDK